MLSLLAGGFSRAEEFGGSGYASLTSLAPGEVYAMLVPVGSRHFNLMAEGCPYISREYLSAGESLYLTPIPEPTTLGLLGAGLLALLRQRRCPTSGPRQRCT
jgi:hypothetical protein